MALVVFVCTGNTCRSPIAEGLARQAFRNHPELQFQSAGVAAVPDTAPTAEAVTAAAALGADIRGHRSQTVRPSLMASAALVIAMTQAQAEYLRTRFPAFGSKVASLGELAGAPERDILDPIGQSPAVYFRVAEHIANDLAASRPALVQRLGLAA